MKIGIFSIGAASLNSAGTNASAVITVPFAKALQLHGHDITWLSNDSRYSQNSAFVRIFSFEENSIDANDFATITPFMINNILNENVKISDFDAIILYNRPKYFKAEFDLQNQLLILCKEFGVPCFVYDADLWCTDIPDEFKRFITLLKPYHKKNTIIKKQCEFHYTHYSDLFQFKLSNSKKFDFIYIGNEYNRRQQFSNFYGLLNEKFKTCVFGNWLRKRKDTRDFALNFKNLAFCGELEYKFALNALSSSNCTIQIVPENYSKIGLMTNRIFESYDAGVLCFADSKIVNIDKFIPKELLIESGEDITQHKYENIVQRKIEIFADWHRLMKKHSIINRVKEFERLI